MVQQFMDAEAKAEQARVEAEQIRVDMLAKAKETLIASLRRDLEWLIGDYHNTAAWNLGELRAEDGRVVKYSLANGQISETTTVLQRIGTRFEPVGVPGHYISHTPNYFEQAVKSVAYPAFAPHVIRERTVMSSDVPFERYSRKELVNVAITIESLRAFMPSK